PGIGIDGEPNMGLIPALLKNLSLVALFALQHIIMARQPFKKWLAKTVHPQLERSVFVLASGLTFSLVLWQWEPLGGTIWQVATGSTAYYIHYILFFIGWAIMYSSSFVINHFDLFGLRQTYFYIMDKPYKPLQFRIVSYYKYMRHPLYFGMMLGMWFTPSMTVTHLSMAAGLTAFIMIAITYEERDLIREFGNKYIQYRNRTPKLIPFLRMSSSAQ
ncbi:isoprenylcysteine carboxylmethyltransferase family protein, partial [bacterium]|nr:isoprenylcysteine carboxylmethyltransferase family protein [bacterium]